MKHTYFLGNFKPGTSPKMLEHCLKDFGDPVTIYVPRDKEGELRNWGTVIMKHSNKAQSEQLLRGQHEVNGRVVCIDGNTPCNCTGTRLFCPDVTWLWDELSNSLGSISWTGWEGGGLQEQCLFQLP